MTLADLNGHLDMLTQLQEAKESLSNMQAKILGASQYDGMPHAHEAARRTENLSIILEAQLDDVARLERIVQKSEVPVKAFISGIEDNRTKLIFSLRYLAGMKWETVAEYIGGGNSFDSVRMTVYRYLNEANASESPTA